MIIDGNSIAREILQNVAEGVKRFGRPVTLGIVVIGYDPIIENFVSSKTKRAAEVGITLRRADVLPNAETDEVRRAVEVFALDDSVHGIVVQLPLPLTIDSKRVLDVIPLQKDTDVLGRESREAFAAASLPVLPPVVGAIREILVREGRDDVRGKHVVVVGKGALVGAPAVLWFGKEGAQVSVADKRTGNLTALMKDADIIVSGAGVPGLITPDMLKRGVMLFDAGTSEEGGVVVGDADPSCAPKCAIFTPVPGGIGPVTVSVLLRNVVTLARA